MGNFGSWTLMEDIAGIRDTLQGKEDSKRNKNQDSLKLVLLQSLFVLLL